MRTRRELERDARRLFRFCVVAGAVDEDRVRMVVKHVLESRRRGYLLLLASLKRMLKGDEARRTAKIESAVPLSSELRSRVQSSLTSTYGPGLSCFFKQQPALIGGIRVQVGSDVYDGSIRSGLGKLAKNLGVRYGNGFSRALDVKQRLKVR